MIAVSEGGQRRHAIVIGASMGGLLAAAALARHFTRVTIVERDDLAAAPQARKGAPQASHAHGLLTGGREAMEILFPGLTESLVGQGALTGDILDDSVWFAHGVYLARARSELAGLLVSRSLLEAEIRRRLLHLPNVRMISRVAVSGLGFDRTSGRVTGVRAEGATPAEEALLAADLVVDATGRGSRGPKWLRELGHDAPAEEEVEVGISYTTRLYERCPDDIGGKLVALVGGYAPSWRFGVALAQEGDKWVVTLGGYFGDAAPSDDAGFREFAGSLAAPEIGALVNRARPVSEITTYRFASSQRRRYEALTRFPEGYLAIADALCSFNPVYGQGMTVAALQARTLDACLASGSDNLAPRFFAAAAKISETPWQIAVGSDLGHPKLSRRASVFQRFLNWYLVRLHHAAADDAALATAFLQVANLKAAPSQLLAPATIWRVAKGNLGLGRSGGDDIAAALPYPAKRSR